MRRRGALLIALMLVGRAGGARAEQQDGFSVALSRATLEVDGRTIAALPPSARVGRPGALELTPDRNRLRARDTASGEERWVAALPVGRRWVGLALGEMTAYGHFTQADPYDLTRPSVGQTRVRWVTDGPDRVRRLSLADGTWRPAWTVEGNVRAAIPLGGDMVVVSDPEPGRVAFACFAADADAPRWTRSFRLAGSPSADAESFGDALARVLAARTTSPVVAAANDVFITCVGSSQEIVALDRVDGSVRWQLDRLWELDRYRDDSSRSGWGFTRPTTDAARRELARRSRIVVGPIVVGSGPGQRIFFGVTRERMSDTVVPIEESVTYELSQAEVVSIFRLPRALRSEGSQAVGDGVLWQCDGAALAFQVPSTSADGAVRRVENSDRTGSIRWYRDPGSASEPDAWLRTEARSPCLVTDGVAAWSVSGGPHVLSAREKAFRVPLRRIDLGSGAVREVTLVVPFSGDLPSWKEAAFREIGASGNSRVEIREAWAVEVLTLGLDRDRLVVDVGATNGGGRAVFPTESLK